MANNGIREIGIVLPEQFKVFDVAQSLCYRGRGFHIGKQEDALFLFRGMVFSGKEVHQYAMTYVLTDLGIKKTYEQTEGDGDHGTCKFDIVEKVPQFVQNDGVKKGYSGLQGGRDRVGDEDDQQQENGIKDKLVANFP